MNFIYLFILSQMTHILLMYVYLFITDLSKLQLRKIIRDIFRMMNYLKGVL